MFQYLNSHRFGNVNAGNTRILQPLLHDLAPTTLILEQNFRNFTVFPHPLGMMYLHVQLLFQNPKQNIIRLAFRTLTTQNYLGGGEKNATQSLVNGVERVSQRTTRVNFTLVLERHRVEPKLGGFGVFRHAQPGETPLAHDQLVALQNVPGGSLVQMAVARGVEDVGFFGVQESDAVGTVAVAEPVAWFRMFGGERQNAPESERLAQILRTVLALDGVKLRLEQKCAL
jgi:hypothetical protein